MKIRQLTAKSLAAITAAALIVGEIPVSTFAYTRQQTEETGAMIDPYKFVPENPGTIDTHYIIEEPSDSDEFLVEMSGDSEIDDYVYDLSGGESVDEFTFDIELVDANDTYADNTEKIEGGDAGISDDLLSDGDAAEVTYTLEDGVLTVSGEGFIPDSKYKGNTEITKLVIEEGITKIGRYTFKECTNLTEVSLPDSMRTISESAFESCTSLESITFNEGISYIDVHAFRWATNLKEVYIPLSIQTASVYYTSNGNNSWGIFEGCNIEKVTFAEGTTQIHAGMFANSNIKTITLPDTLEKIGDRAFGNCPELEAIDFPDSLTYIGELAFGVCPKLTELTIKSTIKEIRAGAFKLGGIKTVNLPANLPDMTIYYTTNGDRTWGLFEGCNLETVNFEEGITKIPGGLFANSNIKTLPIPSTVTEIGKFAFAYCNYLEEVVIPENVTVIGESAFKRCEKLKTLTLSENVTDYGKLAFASEYVLETVSLPANMSSPDVSVTYEYNSNNHGANGIFAGCEKLSNIEFPEGITRIRGGLFAGSGIKTITIPGSVEEIGDYAFASCTKLTSVTYESPIDKIGSCSYANCTALSDIQFPENVTEIGEFAFFGCTAIKKLVLPENLVTVRKQVFNNCTGLTEVVLPQTFDETNYYYSYNTSSRKASGLFAGCTNLKTIEIPYGVEYIPAGLFGGSRIEEIVIPNTVKRIGSYSFSDTCLTNIIIPDSVERIGYCAFAANAYLESVTMSKNWNTCVGFDGGTGPSYQGALFFACPNLTIIVLPEGMTTIPAYGLSNSNYLEEVIIPDSVTEIGEGAFYNCTSLNSISIPDDVEKIEKETFKNCSNLLVVNVPESVDSIGENAFYSCNLLSAVNYPGSDEKWNNISKGKGNDKVNSQSALKTNAKLSFTKDDFFGMWDGEYDGEYNSVTTRRHFVLRIEETTSKNGELINFKGYRTVSKSQEVVTEEYFVGSDDIYGSINLSTGSISMRGVNWIEYPVSNKGGTFSHVSYKGFLEGSRITGHVEGRSDRTFYIDFLSSVSNSKTTVSVTRDGKKYNLLQDETVFEKDSDEMADIIVVPDWGKAKPGTVRLAQGKNKIESKTGLFVDCQPGKTFEKDKPILLYLVDESGKSIDAFILTLKIGKDHKSRLKENLESVRITVEVNQKLSTDKEDKYITGAYVPIENGGEEFATDASGVITMDVDRTEKTIFSKTGYVTRELTIEQLRENPVTRLQKENSGNPVISGVWIGNVDVLNTDYFIDVLSKDSTGFKAEVDWQGGSAGNIYLIQDDRKVAFSGNTLTTVISDKFNVDEDIYILAVNSAGTQTRRKLRIGNGVDDPEFLKGFTIGFDGGIKVTLPEDFKPGLFAGQSFSVGEGLSSDTFPITVEASDGKIYIAIGIDLFSFEGSKTSTKSTKTGKIKKDSEKEAKTFIDMIKDTTKEPSKAQQLKKLKNIKQYYKYAIKYPKSSFGVEADITLLGFAEGIYDRNGKVTIMDAGLLLNPTLDVSYNYPFTIMAGPIPIPMYAEAEFNADITGKLNIRLNETAKNFVPNGEVSGDLALSGGIGAGMKKVLYVGGGITGKLSPTWKIRLNEEDYFKLVASVNLYAKAGIGPFEGKYDFDPIKEATWIEIPNSRDLRSDVYTVPENGIVVEKFYEMSDFKLKDLSYVNSGSKFVINQSMTGGDDDLLRNAGPELDEFKTNVYRETTPVIATLPSGKIIAVWNDLEEDDPNKVYLYYSVYSNGTWSVPKAVKADGTMDYEPCLKVVNGKACLAWQNAAVSFNNLESLGANGIASAMNISAGVFDETTDTFKVKNFQTDNLDMLPDICGDENGIYVAWVNNPGNEWFADNGDIKIMYTKYADGSWSSAAVAYDNLHYVDSLAADYNGELKLAYSVDTDGDITTADDSRIYENGEMISDDVISTSPVYVDHTLMWYANSNIVSTATKNISGDILNDNYKLLKIGGKLAALYSSSNELATNLYLSYYDEATMSWGKGSPITTGDDFIGAFDGYTDEEGNLFVFMNSTDVTGDISSPNPYGESTLRLFGNYSFCDLALDDVFYFEDSFIAGEDMPFTLTVSNEGNEPIEGVHVEIADAEGNVLSSEDFEDSVMPGVKTEIEATCGISDEATSQDLKISVSPINMTDIDTDNNTETITLSYEKMFVENITYSETEEGKTVISVDAVNRGYSARSGMTIELRKAQEDGELVKSEVVSSVNPMDIKTVSFTIDARRDDVYYILLKDTASGEVLASDFVAIYYEPTQEEIENRKVSVTDVSLSLDGMIGLNYYTKLPENCSYALLECNGKTVKTSVDLARDVDGKKVFTYKLPAKNIRDNVKISFYDSDDNKLEINNSNEDEGYGYSSAIIDYINEVETGEYSQELKSLTASLKTYGSYAQKYFGYNADDSDCKNPAEVQLGTLSPYAKTINGTIPAGLKYYGSSLILESGTKIRHYFQTNNAIGNYTFAINGTPVSPKEADGLYYVEVSGIPATEINKTNKLTVNGYEINYSALSYAYDVLNKSDNENLKAVAKSLYWYSVAAGNYFK